MVCSMTVASGQRRQVSLHTTRGVQNTEKSVRGCILPGNLSLGGYKRRCYESKVTDAENGPVHIGTRSHLSCEVCGHLSIRMHEMYI